MMFLSGNVLKAQHSSHSRHPAWPAAAKEGDVQGMKLEVNEITLKYLDHTEFKNLGCSIGLLVNGQLVFFQIYEANFQEIQRI